VAVVTARPVRPLSILLASDDLPFVDKLSAAAAERGVALHTVGAEQDVDVALAQNGANVYVVDANRAVRRGARSATAFAARHPGIPVVLLADRADAPAAAGLILLDKLRPTAGLLGAIETAYVAACSMI
jgi:DNA-binding NtrC family response regulator